jgi:hypothetical protein
VLIPSGSSLTIDPGTVVKMWANASQWDTLSVTEGLCDLIVEGALHIDGGSSPLDSVWVKGWLPLQEIAAEGGQWGSVAFLASAEDSSCTVEHGSLVGATVGVAAIDASPLVSNSLIYKTASHGLEGSGEGFLRVDGCAVSASGSGVGASVTPADSLGGLRLENSSVDGEVRAEGYGKVELLNNPLLGSVYLNATQGSDSLQSWVIGNDVAGNIEVRSLSQMAKNVTAISGNSALSIYLDAWSSAANGISYIDAEVDSNEVGSGGIVVTAGVWLYTGYIGGYKSFPGSIAGSMEGNRVAGAFRGINLGLGELSGNFCGDMSMNTAGNHISGCTTGMRVHGSAMTLAAKQDTIISCDTGIDAANGSVSFISCLVTGNTKGFMCTGLASGVLGGSLEETNDIYDNGGQNIEASGSIVNAEYNYWGTVVEDSLLAMLSGPVSYSPWTDSSHTALYTSTYKKGLIAGSESWSGDVRVTGDVLIPSGSSLTIDPGTVVKMLSNACQWDTLGVTEGRCDLIVEGELNVNGGPSPADSVWVRAWLPLEEVDVAPGQWGSVAFLGSSDDSACVIDHGSLAGGTVGVKAVDASPLIRHSLVTKTSSHGFEGTGDGYLRISGCEIVEIGSNKGVTVTPSDSLGGLRLEGSSVEGEVIVEGHGKVELLNNPYLGSVFLNATNGADSLYSWVVGNTIEGQIELHSRWDHAKHIAVVSNNTASGIYSYTRTHSRGGVAYMDAVIDSNYVGSGGINVGAGAWVRQSAWVWYSYPGSFAGSMAGNTVSGADRGINLEVGHNGSSFRGNISMATMGNHINGCTTGIRMYGDQVDLTADQDTVANCGTGITGLDRDLFVDDCTFIGSPSCDWALSVTPVDSFRFVGNFVDDWTNGISLSPGTWSEIRQNDIAGRQEGYGISCVGSSPVIQDNYIDRFLTAVRCESDANPVITHNSLACAPNWGVNNTSPGITIDATGNWWGNATGPYHASANPSGLGSPVSDNVLFSSWLTDYPNRPPMEFELLYPLTEAVLDTVPTLDWTDSRDLDCHGALTYTLQISEDSLYTSPAVLDGLADSECELPYSMFEGGKRYFWKVFATDGDTLTWCGGRDWEFTVSATVDVTDPRSGYPKQWVLLGNAPNPFAAGTQIRFGAPRRGFVEISIFDVAGRLVRKLVEDVVPPGYHAVEWDGRNAKGRKMASGVYFYRFKAGEVLDAKKMLMVR